MKTTAVSFPCIILFFLTLCFSGHTQELYRWVDIEGNIHYTTKYEWIPEQYRSQVAKKSARKRHKTHLSVQEKSNKREKLTTPSPSNKKVVVLDQPVQEAEKTSKFVLKSPVISDKGKIPFKYTRRGGNISPPLIWENPPADTKSYALTVTDPDAPGGPFTHWIVYNISGDQGGLPEGVPRKMFANGAQQTRNDFNGIGYGGPDPVDGTRKYIFTLVALDVEKVRKPRMEILKEHTLGEATLTAFYP